MVHGCNFIIINVDIIIDIARKRIQMTLIVQKSG